MTRRLEIVLAAAIYALLAAVVFSPSLFQDRLFVPMHTAQFEPWRQDATREQLAACEATQYTATSDKLISFRPDDEITLRGLANGRVPLWNESTAGGVPHLAQGLYGVLYPPHWIALWLSPERAYGWLAAFHHWLAAFGVFLLMRAIGGRFGGSLLAGLSFGFATCLLARAHYYVYVESIGWAPLGLLAVESWLRRGSWLALGALALIAALILLVGWPLTAAFSLFTIGLAALIRSLRVDLGLEPRKLFGSTLLVVAGAAAISPFFTDPLPLVAFWPYVALLLAILVAPRKLAFAKKLGGVGLAMFLGVAIAAVQYLPAIEWMRGGGSRQASAPEQQVAGALRPGFLVEAFLPGAFGVPQDFALELQDNLQRWAAVPIADAVAAGGRLNGYGNVLENALYFGLLPLLLAPFGLVLGRSPRKFFLGFLALVFSGFALGVTWIVYPAYFAGFFAGTDPRRALLMAVFALACLGGLGFDALSRRPRLARRVALGFAAFALLVVGVATLGRGAVYSLLLDRASSVAAAFGVAMPEVPHARAHLDAAADRVLLQYLVVAPLAVLALWLAPRRRMVRIAALIAALATAADLWLAARPYVGTQAAAGFLAGHPYIDAAKEAVGDGGRGGRIARADLGGRALPEPIDIPLAPNLGAAYGLLDAWCYTVSPPKRYMRLADALFQDDGAGPPLKPPGESPSIVGGVFVPALTTLRQLESKALDVMGVRAILGRGELPDVLPAGLSLAARFGHDWIVRNDDALPRAFTVGAAVALEGEPLDVILNHVLSPAFDPRRSVVLERPVDPIAAGEGDGALPAVAWSSEAGEELRFALEAGERGGWLVVLDGHDPGWRASVDGAETPVLVANGAFRAVRFERGAREIVMRYQPASFRLGAAISIAALVATLLLLAAAALRGARYPRGAQSSSPAGIRT
jgi:hypothetical protein